MGIFAYGGGEDGIAKYLKDGAKQGREYTRDELDKRIILDGDLDKTDKIIQSMDRDGEKFNHITFSFKENEISEDVLKAITQDIKKYLLAAYGENEIDFYAEAHIPKIETYIDHKTLEMVERKPHIHIIIPTINLVTGERASPLELMTARYGTKDKTMDMLDAIQEHINAKYGLASPKDNRRANFTSDTAILARQKGDDFPGHKSKVKLEEIRDRMIAERIETPEAFKAMLSEIGTWSIGKKGQPDSYYQVRLHGETQNIRLKDLQFTDDFIGKPTADKEAFIAAARQQRQYETAKEAKPTPDKYLQLLDKWEDRAREIKYLETNNKFFKETYTKLTRAEKSQVLDVIETEHYQRLKETYGYDRTTGQISAGPGQPGEDELLQAIRENLTESSRNFSYISEDYELDEDAIRRHFESVGEALATYDDAEQFRSIGNSHSEYGAFAFEEGEINEYRLQECQRNIDANLRTASNAFGLVERDRASLFDAATASRANLDRNAFSHRLDAWSNGRINSIYLRTNDEIRIAEKAGQAIIKEPESVINALTFSQSSFSANQLERYLLKNTSDSEQYEDALAAVLKSPALVTQKTDKSERFTSAEIVAIEQRLIDTVGRLAKASGSALQQKNKQDIVESRNFNQGQEAAFNLLCSDMQIAVVNGAAGTGKSYVLGAMREAYEAEGKSVYGAILQGKTAEDLERDSGIKSQTMHSFLYGLNNGKIKLNKNDVVVTDEAGMIGSRQMEQLLTHIESSGAKLRLVGDKNQLAAVEYGNAFEEISKRCKVENLTQIMRQKEDWQIQASERFSKLDVRAGMTMYAEKNSVREYDTKFEAMSALVDDWNTYRAENPDKSQIVLVATNAERHTLNKMMRDSLKEQGSLNDEITLKTDRNASIKIATGDTIMFTKNDYAMGVKNGTVGTIKSIDKDILTVELPEGKEVLHDMSKEAAIDYAYAITVHKSQGMSVDQTRMLANSIMNAEMAGVGMTRHRDDATMYFASEDFAEEAGKSSYENMVNSLAEKGNKEFTANGKNWSATRQDDSVVSQLIADHNTDSVLENAARDASYQEMKKNLDASRVLDYVENSHGIQKDLYQVTKAEDGSDRIQCGKRDLDIAAFLTKKMGLDYKTEALEIMKQCYADQVLNAYSQNAIKPSREHVQEYAEFRQQRDMQYKAARALIDTEARDQKAAIKGSAETSTRRAEAIKEVSAQAKEAKAQLRAEYDKPSIEIYKEFEQKRALRALGDADQVKEVVSVTAATESPQGADKGQREDDTEKRQAEAVKAFEDAEKRLAEKQAIDDKAQEDAEDDNVTMLASMEDLPQGVAMEYLGSNEEFASFEVVEKDANKAHKSHQEQRRVFVMPMTSALKEKLFAAKLEKGDKFKAEQKQDAKVSEKKTEEQVAKKKI